MKKTINTKKLKVSQVLGIYQHMPNYPSSEDILYEMIKDFCNKHSNDYKFTDVSLKTKYQLDDIKLNTILDELINNDIISIIEKKPNHTTFKLMKNPYEN